MSSGWAPARGGCEQPALRCMHRGRFLNASLRRDRVSSLSIPYSRELTVPGLLFHALVYMDVFVEHRVPYAFVIPV